MADLTIEKVCERFEDSYGDLGRSAGQRLRQWLSGDIPYAYPELI